MKRIKVSVIIPAYDEEGNIEKTLWSLLVQKNKRGKDVDKSLFDVIVVDNVSTDRTKEVINKFKKANTDLNLFLISESRKGMIPARAKGFRYALKINNNIKTLLLASTDADVIVNPNWIEDIIKTFLKTRADFLVGGSFFPKEFWQKAPHLGSWFKKIKTIISKINRDFIFMEGGNNFVITRQMYKKSGGYDICRGEILRSDKDRILGFNVKLKGGKFAYLDSPNIVSPRRFVFTLNDLIEKGTYGAPMIDVRNGTSIEKQTKIIDELALRGKLNTAKYIKNFIKDYLFVIMVLEPNLLIKKGKYFKGASTEIKKYLSKHSVADCWNNLDLVLERAEYLTNKFWKRIYQNIKK